MNITENTAVADIAASIPSSVRIFQRAGVDFCCGGRKPLGAVCREHGLSFKELAHAIEESAATAPGTDRDWTTAPLGDLIDHIITTYHVPLCEELPRLEAMATRVQRVHAAKAPRLLGRIESIVGELAADLNEHMRKEELVLFRAIRTLEQGGRPALPLSAPITVLEHEHDRAGELLEELRTITGNFTPPEWACATVAALYHGLAELEGSMHVHVHLENNILFPRALRLSDAAPA